MMIDVSYVYGLERNIKDLNQKIKELENINDKLSSALDSAEQRIDKAIEICNIVIKNEPLQAIPNEDLLDQVCGIKDVLQGEEAKDNDNDSDSRR